jgi:Transcription factor WhiB
MLFAACSELEVRESDRPFFCGRGQARLDNQARAVCASCEVQGECLEFAIRNPEETEYGCGAGPPRENVGGCADGLDEEAFRPRPGRGRLKNNNHQCEITRGCFRCSEPISKN